jgi:hypothetical protein
MGFPLGKGSLDGGLLTCHWHHARSDLRSGYAFDLWADDTPVFEVRDEGDDIWISKGPVQRVDAVFHFVRLGRGLEENIGLVQAKNIVALLAEGEGTRGVIREIAESPWLQRRVWLQETVLGLRVAVLRRLRSSIARALCRGRRPRSRWPLHRAPSARFRRC